MDSDKWFDISKYFCQNEMDVMGKIQESQSDRKIDFTVISCIDLVKN